MIVALWYNVAEQLPGRKDWYVAKKEVSMVDEDDVGIGWYKWDGKGWKDSELSQSRHVNVSYWTDVDFDNVTHIRGKLTATEQAAYDDIQLAIEKFKVIQALSRKNNSTKE